MRILSPARRILSREERKLVQTAIWFRIRHGMIAGLIVPALVLSACGRPAPRSPEPQPAPDDMAKFERTRIQTRESGEQLALPTPIESHMQPTPVPVAKPGAKGYRSGIWLEGRWIESGANPEAVSDLVYDLAKRGITDLYIRTSSFRADGTLSLPDAERVAVMRRETDRRGLRLWAWLPGLRRRIDLSAEATVRTAAESVAKLAATGFEGVQLDLEPTPDDDAGYLALLDAIQTALPRGKLLGTATHLVRPHPARAEWTPAYFAEVARRVDQVALMAYDTYAATPEEFRANVAYQTEIALTRSPAKTEVLIGVPTYEDRTERHTPEREPTWAGFAGVADGLRRADLAGRVTGWALYAHFTTSEEEWQLYLDRPGR